MIILLCGGMLNRISLAAQTHTSLPGCTETYKYTDAVLCRSSPRVVRRRRNPDCLDTTEMKIVHGILRMWAESLSMQAIADALNESGALTKQGGTQHVVCGQDPENYICKAKRAA